MVRSFTLHRAELVCIPPSPARPRPAPPPPPLQLPSDDGDSRDEDEEYDQQEEGVTGDEAEVGGSVGGAAKCGSCLPPQWLLLL